MNLEEIDKWLKEEEGISYTELGNEFNDAVELSNKCAKKIMQKDKEIKRLHSIIKEAREYIENHSITNMEWWITGEQKIECKFMKDANPQELLEILDKENI